MKTNWKGHRWYQTGERCCMTHRLVPVDNTASPCLAVVYERCPANHAKSTPHCKLPLLYRWDAFEGTRMTDGLCRSGVAANLALHQAERKVARAAVAMPE